MDFAEIRIIIKEIEAKYKVNNWSANAILIWPLIKYDLYEKLFKLNSTLIRSEMKKIFWGKFFFFVKDIIMIFSSYILDYKNNASIKKVDAVFYGYNQNRNFKMQSGEYFNIYIDPFIYLLKKVGMDALFFEQHHIMESKIPRYSKSIFTKIPFYYFKIKSKFKSEIHTIKLDGYDEFCQDILKIHGVQPLTKNEIEKQMSYIEFVMEYYLKILKRSGARIGICVDHCSHESMGLILACRRMNIPSMDIQHGVIGNFHPGYTNWSVCPQNGYQLLPRYFWCWREMDASKIKLWAKQSCDNHKVICGGNLWNALWLEETDHFLSGNGDINNFPISKLTMQKYKKIILFALQKNIVIEDYVYDAIIESPEEWLWIVRLHPLMLNSVDINMVRNRFQQISNVCIDLGDKIPLPKWLRLIDVHLTYYSSVTIEAALFGVKTVLLCGDTSIYMDEASLGFVKRARNKKELLSILISIDKKSNGRSENIQINESIKLLVDLIKEGRSHSA